MSDAQSSTSTDRPPSPLRRQRACLPCSRAKARCNFSENDVAKGCDRCRRMKIECAPQTTKVLRRPRQLKPVASSRATSLEHKIDGITSLLEASSGNFLSLNDPNEVVGDDSSLGTPPSISTPDPFPDHYDRNSFQSYGLNSFGQATHQFEPPSFVQPPAPALSYPQHSSLSYGGTSPGFGLTWGQAEQAISNFKIKFMPNFPFVALRPEIFAEQLYLEKPLLFKVIMLVAVPATITKQNEIQRWITAYIGQHLLVLENRDLDLLQGLLVFIAWGNHRFYLDRQITHLIYLAVGYAHNLGITRFPPSRMQKIKQAVNPEDFDEAMRGRRLTTVAESFHTLEEMRAFLGCYYVLSVNSSQFRRHDSLKRSYVDYCLSCVAQSVDCWTDSNLDKMVRLQQVVERISETFPTATDDHQPGNKTFVYIMNHEMRPIREQADKICESFDRDQMQSATFWLHYNYTLVRLYEPATWLPTSPAEPNAPFLRCQCLLYCLQAARSFLDVLLTSAAEDLLSRAFVSSAELVGVLVTASRLLLLDGVDDWDRDMARQTLDLSAILGQLVAALAGASLLRKQRALEGGGGLRDDDPGEEDEDFFAKYIEKIKWIKVWFDSRVGGGVASDEPGGAGDVLPDIWSLEENAGNQFWLGMMGNNFWNIDF